ncbi:transporter substrate-binding domain-containing protein [Oceanobacillus sp. 143]|uniref:Amino acid ABC transporter substrate-binding protein n=1 Tax=Oceanobacillus zhaokaii TaxID=2052660 RepID=A0A345PF39_9BACI|nr:amino acid ABC transporter substrate-binding protein [Oceanobacillus zhaokaii]AXI08619.1 amino acid ABC transporter substrate-binding protein [Oceanobacillus zhaokaii]QGS68398.1 transporter substrate-binding domain-containing protein [Oceanobacillus sp. 143]
MKNKLMLGLTMLILTILLAACGSNEKNEESNTDNAADDSANLYDQVMEKGVLTVGTEGVYAPFSFHNEKDELTGYDVEVIEEVAKRMGVTVDFQETQWDSMFAGLNSERFDLIANQVGINEERLANYDFSIPYTHSSAVVVVPKDNTDITSFEDLEGKNSAQSLTSNYGAIAEENGAVLVGVEGLAQAIELIKQGRADVTVNDKLALLDYVKQTGDEEIKIVAEAEDTSDMAFVFNKGNEELVDAINEQLEAMKEDGTLAQISEEWFGEDVSTK